MDLISQRDYATFYRNGIVYDGLPRGGQIDNMDLNSTCAQDPTDCGTYYIEGTKLITQFPNNAGLLENDTTSVRSPLGEAPGLSVRRHSLSKLTPVTAVRLDGAYTSLAGSTSGPSGSFARSQTIVFFPDGRYESNKSIGFTATPGGINSDNGGVVGYTNSGPNQGTYTIQGYTLTLRPSAGPVRTATILFFDDERPVKSVLIDDEFFKR
jgi:hypothetical protein